jgi:membrane protease YdiL (CAAX protease family)
MQRVYTAQSELEAHEARLFLESRGIRALVDGESAAFTNLSFTPGSEPGILVDDVDAEPAKNLLIDFKRSQPVSPIPATWKCAHCGETCDSHFELCWNCEEPRCDAVEATPEPTTGRMLTSADETDETDEAVDTSPPTDSGRSPHSKFRLWIEVVLLLLITSPWLVISGMYSRLSHIWGSRTFASQSATTAAFELFSVSCALVLIWLSGEPWSNFGLSRLRPLWHLFGAGILCLVTRRVLSLSNGLFIDWLREWMHPEDFQHLFEDSGRWVAPHGGYGILVAIVVSLCIGFSEELVYRGVLLHRFEQLFRSTWIAVLLTSLLFAAMHYPSGILSVWNALGLGLVFGTVFAMFRDLWPLVFAHAVIDFVVILRSGSFAP